MGTAGKIVKGIMKIQHSAADKTREAAKDAEKAEKVDTEHAKKDEGEKES